MKLFLLDAYALIYRAYYGFIKNPRINSRGENVSAVFGFLNSLEEVLSKEQPTHIGVAFDPAGGTFRHFDDRDIVGLENLLDDGCAEADGFGSLLALSLIRGIGFVAEGASGRVEGHTDMCGLLL